MTILLPVRPTHDGVFIDIIDRDITTKDLGDGKVLHLIADDSFLQGVHNSMEHKHPGIRPRWARVLEIGPEVDEIEPGDLVLCDTLKWGRKIQLGRYLGKPVYFWNIKVTDILGRKDHAGDEYLLEMRQKLNLMEFNLGRL